MIKSKKNCCFSRISSKQKRTDYATVIFSYIIIISSQLFSLVFVDIFLWIEVSPVLLIIDIILTILIIYHLIICHCIDPGILKPGHLELSEEEQKKNADQMFNRIRFYLERYCKTCKIMRPPKSSHCRECNHCVKGFDHHCFFVGNCIGVRNWGNFLYFLTFTTLLIIYRIIFSLVTISLIFERNEGIKFAYKDEIEIFFGTFVFLGLACIAFFLWKKHPFVYLSLTMMAFVFVIAGSVEAIKKIPGLKYYGYPIFSLVNIVFHFPFLFWLVPVTIANYCNAMLLITTKERNALNEAMIFKPEALNEKKRIICSKKLSNLWQILCSKRIKNETH